MQLRGGLPIIGISMGDPAGIGPEICAKTLALEEIYHLCRPIVVGDAGVVPNAVAFAPEPEAERLPKRFPRPAFTLGRSTCST